MTITAYQLEVDFDISHVHFDIVPIFYYNGFYDQLPILHCIKNHICISGT